MVKTRIGKIFKDSYALFSFVEPEQPATYYENINQLLKVCMLSFNYRILSDQICHFLKVITPNPIEKRNTYV